MMKRKIKEMLTEHGKIRQINNQSKNYQIEKTWYGVAGHPVVARVVAVDVVMVLAGGSCDRGILNVRSLWW